MEELIELRTYLEHQEYDKALSLVAEMEEMSREDKLNKIGSYIEIMLIHLIKQHAEKRTTRSWDVSIRNAADAVQDVNQRGKGRGYYFPEDELREVMDRRYLRAIRRASLEALEGRYDEKELAAKLKEAAIKSEALRLIASQS